MKNLVKLIERLIKIKWYGKIEISMEHGNIILIRKTETIKLENLK